MYEGDDIRIIRRRQIYILKTIEALEELVGQLDERWGPVEDSDIREYETAVLWCAVNPAAKLTEYIPLVSGDPAVLFSHPFPPN